MRVNPGAHVRVETVVGELPVLYVDDFYTDPDAVRVAALGAAFDTSLAYYPGRHAAIPPTEAAQVIAYICRILNAIGDAKYVPEAFETDFSIVTTRPADLLGKQKHPHVDPTPILGLVYLNPRSTVGTSFYENTFLGTSSIRTAEHAVQLQAYLEGPGQKHEPAGYDLSGHPHWKKYYTIEGRYNRMVIYPGNFFHAIDLITVPERLTLAEARLTQRFICNRLEQNGGATT